VGLSFTGFLVHCLARAVEEHKEVLPERMSADKCNVAPGSPTTVLVAALRVASRGGFDGPVVTVLPDA
jgi:hypothetical protein